MKKMEIQTEKYLLISYQRISRQQKMLRIYIEGDGYAWVNSTQPSRDPTPRHALGLQLAAIDPYENVVYLARPCQYNLASNPTCNFHDWTDLRYSEPIIQSINQSVNQIKKNAQAETIELVGYSGGAAIAAIISARRHDVVNLRTIAGNLDSEAVNQFHHVSTMPLSLNPISVKQQLTQLPQRHFIAENDAIIPAFIAKKFAEHNEKCAELTITQNTTHELGWREQWPSLVKQAVSCR